MDISPASLEVAYADYLTTGPSRSSEGTSYVQRPTRTIDQETLRRTGWEIGERRSGDSYLPTHNHVALGMVHPLHGFAHWHILRSWVDDVARSRGDLWNGSRPILRLYDVSFIEFNGLNAHRYQDEHLADLSGQRFFTLPAPGTWQLAEVGFLLRNNEFIPAARSIVVPFAPDSPSRHGSQEALFVRSPGRIESISNVWNADHELREKRRPHLRHPLRIAALAFASRPSGHQGTLADFVTELAMGQRACGHKVHVLVPRTDALSETREIDGVIYHPLAGITGADPIEQAKSFAVAAEKCLTQLPPFDLIHHHEWMTGLGSWVNSRPTVLSMSSIESTRRNGPADGISSFIAEKEREIAQSAGCVLTPPWIRERVVNEYQLDLQRVHPFAMEGRLANEWEAPLDIGQVKNSYGIGPLDRLILFVGPLEHAAGVDLLIEALPVLLRRWGNLRIGYIGNGPMHGQLERRSHEMGVAWAVRFLGHQSGSDLIRLLRSAEAVVLPSRHRIAMDDAVIDLARKAARPVVTTHGGPAYLVRHEENGLITYDNPGSMVWALDRILGDPEHTQRMGQNGRHSEAGTPRWSEVARIYLEGCVHWFPELTVTQL